jgi:anti-sigma B factor antagonist
MTKYGDSRESGTVIITVRGELDILAVKGLRTMLFTPTALAGSRLVVDLTDTSFLDSSGVGALVAARRWATSHNTDFALVCPEGPVHRTLRVVGLDRVFAIHASVPPTAAVTEAPSASALRLVRPGDGPSTTAPPV